MTNVDDAYLAKRHPVAPEHILVQQLAALCTE